MTRKNQIHEIANTISTDIGKEIDEDYICNDEYDFTIGFECGAKWADENPKAGLVSIDKVCGLLKTNIDKYTTIKTIGCDGAWVWREIFMTDKGLEEFRKAMEDNI